MAQIPSSVWEQIPVVIVFALLLTSMGYVLVRTFSKAVAEINSYYSQVVKDSNTQFAKSLTENNAQWQLYFDTRAKMSELINAQIIDKLEKLTVAHAEHDIMMKHALDKMQVTRKKKDV